LTPSEPLTCDSSRRRARFFSEEPDSTARPASTIAKNDDAIARTSQITDIDIHDLSHPDDPEPEQYHCRARHEQAELGRNEQSDVVGAHGEHIEGDSYGKCNQHPRRQTALGSEDLDLSPHHRALAQCVGDVVQDLGQVAADFPLDVDGEHGPLEVGATHADRQRLERLVDRATEPDLGDHTLKLGRRRLRDLTSYGVESLHEAVACSQ
jgi:hypothetical protein